MPKSSSHRKMHSNKYRRVKPMPPKTSTDFFTRSEEFRNDWEETLRVISKMRSDGLSLRKAANQEGVNPRTVSRLAGRALKRRSNGSYVATKSDSLLRVMKILTSEGPREIELRNSRDASRLGEYWSALHKALNGETLRLAKFQRRSVTDARGVNHAFVTDMSELKRLGFAGVLSFESIYSRAA